MAEQTANFEGWAKLELMGHQQEIGYVTTQYFGGAAMFQVDVPELPERERITERPTWIDDRHVPAGTKVTLAAVQGRTRLISPAALYAMNPCTEEVAKRQLQQDQCTIKLVELPEQLRLPGEVEAVELDEDCENHADDEDD